MDTKEELEKLEKFKEDAGEGKYAELREDGGISSHLGGRYNHRSRRAPCDQGSFAVFGKKCGF